MARTAKLPRRSPRFVFVVDVEVFVVVRLLQRKHSRHDDRDWRSAGGAAGAGFP
jgi:hypothetical protein